MSGINRRQFGGATLAALGTAAAGPLAADESQRAVTLPTVRWGEHRITRLLVGHNPIKGQSHFSAELNREMREWFAGDPGRAGQLVRRCEQLGINACQMGGPAIEEMLRKHYADGGKIRWIATFYSPPGSGKEELARILKISPRPIGVQQLGNVCDGLMRDGNLERVQENLKMFRDAGLLVGLGSHNHEVIDHVEDKGWDLDFYQCCFYRSCFSLDRSRRGEIFEEEARQSMVKTIRRVSKPCIAFKVLGANRHCHSPTAVEAAIRFAYKNIKPNDVVLLGMWQKHRDQVAENVGYARKVLGVA
ncbi:MAG: hypothetical protein HQ567_22550 [Candidatus Nealsonbacteria bacterium]|nr:hypothetical protein [Candidatus Nealsonbacteria bacterium]